MKCLQIDRRRSVTLLAAALAGLGLGTPWLALAEGYPTKPIQLIVPFPPGGAVDIVGRTISKKLGDRLGQPIVIENKAGAGTVVGAAFVANAPADGYTLLISSGSTFTVNPALNAKLPYDPVKSYEPIGMVARVPLILLANREVPVGNLKQLIGAVQRAPDKFSYGSFGNGTTGHFAAELTWSAAGIKVMHVPYRGSAPAMSDLMGGQIPFTIDTVAAALPQLKAGKIKAIAVTGATRATQLPDVPTVAESGFPGFSADSWLAVVAPRGLPAEAKAKLHKALADTLADAEVRSKLIAAGLEPSYATGDAVLTQIEDELPRMRAIAQRAQIRAD
ncbi:MULTISPECIES: tripartite tricarboxylate transporter substrate binding protein [unclassified Acidovorax]|jgi:tripartite-type tricarboxylate transporter receptor subunit TctC|uniref:Bug family tripartite tricarboxylate transporter substrate binding protein n=1 Tax=unclassified Acidovorax TaxID=2684926 RepID=UPI001C45512D|nr:MULTISPECIES: tripartite tricarboxylate transporter substrate binding protein [unclassified Acidovorax]MBV7462440.1 tripartite tricarboxylate transporter substrate binding protein [Acidovorax sp. sif0632]MBV7467467.1 tripartite tricarboxylate transporter substrate binding protein [Acidovorax sp. sif0613]